MFMFEKSVYGVLLKFVQVILSGVHKNHENVKVKEKSRTYGLLISKLYMYWKYYKDSNKIK